jgi:hypothetical protein
MRKAFLLALVVPAALLASATFAQSQGVLDLKARIPLANVNGRMDHMAVDLTGQRVFAAAFDNHTLEVIDVQAGKQARTISNLTQPQATYFDAASNRLFASSGGDGTVKIFDGTTFALQQTVALSADADNMRFDARARHVIVGYGGEKFLNGQVARGQGLKDGALAILDSAGQKVGEVATDGHPESFQLEQNGTRVFINVPDKKEVLVADLANNNVLAHWSLPGCENYPMALDEAHHRVFVMCRATSTVAALDTETGKQVASIPLTASASSDDMFYDPGKRRLYVLARIARRDNPRAAGPGLVEVFQHADPDHYEKIASEPTGFGAQTGFFVPEWGKLFVATRRQPGGPSGEILVYETR